MKCLIVEDSIPDQILMTRLLEPWGLADVADNGEVVYDLFKRASAEEDPYDIIFLDIMMPGMDGNEVLRKIRDWEKNHLEGEKPVQIVMSTAKNDTDTIVRSFDEGCQHYMLKPYDRSELSDLMEKMGFQKIKSSE